MVVSLAGGGGVLLLDETHPPSANGSSRTTTGIRRIWGIPFASSRQTTRLLPGGGETGGHLVRVFMPLEGIPAAGLE
jgi:hypothetical protein